MQIDKSNVLSLIVDKNKSCFTLICVTYYYAKYINRFTLLKWLNGIFSLVKILSSFSYDEANLDECFSKMNYNSNKNILILLLYWYTAESWISWANIRILTSFLSKNFEFSIGFFAAFKGGIIRPSPSYWDAFQRPHMVA